MRMKYFWCLLVIIIVALIPVQVQAKAVNASEIYLTQTSDHQVTIRYNVTSAKQPKIVYIIVVNNSYTDNIKVFGKKGHRTTWVLEVPARTIKGMQISVKEKGTAIGYKYMDEHRLMLIQGHENGYSLFREASK